ncbi:MAG: ATP synthase F0 subunit A [Porphyromonadaceae bacterium CG2_30_38_12]|nr:MAG: ATP synthase F0 subunit A [Porphyromonadaceae bacterium CG2_30_38_12]
MNKFLNIVIVLLFAAFSLCYAAVNEHQVASEQANKEQLNVREFILEHISDSYEWHVTKIGEYPISIPLPVILYSSTSGWHVFLSLAFHHDAVYEGFTIAHEGKYKGKIIELQADGSEIRPFDISITKNVFSLLFSSLLLIIIILSVAKSYRRTGIGANKGFVAFMEMFIMNVNDDIIKPCVGKDYKRYAPYLLTVFFFIFINNILGLIPIFPGGANVTGNIAITFVLAVCTFLIVNFSGSKEYWREILWPDVPLWLKAPFPMMPLIELVGIFTKPFALMIRLFANMMAGHSIVLGLTALVFVTVSLGPVMNTSMTVVSVIFSIFISFVELLVAYIQAYIFTMLSAVFIGLARIEPHHKPLKTNGE